MPRIVLDDPRDFLEWREASGGTVEIFDIVVDSGRREGKGRKLVQELLRAIPKTTRLVWAITRESNEIAKDFYHGVGFRIVAHLAGFYWDVGEVVPVNALMFGKDLPLRS